MAELVAYLSIGENSRTALVDDKEKEEILWTDREGIVRRAMFPRIVLIGCNMEERNYEAEFSVLLIYLMKSVMNRDDNPSRWQQLLQYQGELRDYLSRMALDLVIFEDEGYAYLKNREDSDEEGLPALSAGDLSPIRSACSWPF